MPRRRPTGNRAPTMRVFTVLAHRVCAYKRIGRTPEIMTGDFPDMLLRRSPAENLENVRFLRRLHGSNDRHDDEEVGAPPRRTATPLVATLRAPADRHGGRAGSCQRGLKRGAGSAGMELVRSRPPGLNRAFTSWRASLGP